MSSLITIHHEVTSEEVKTWSVKRIDDYVAAARALLLAAAGFTVASPEDPRDPPGPVEGPPVIKPPPKRTFPVPVPDRDAEPAPPAPPAPPAAPADPPAKPEATRARRDPLRDPWTATIVSGTPTVDDARRLMEEVSERTGSRILRIIREGKISVAEFVSPHEPKQGFHVFGRLMTDARRLGFPHGVVEKSDDGVSLRPDVIELFRAAVGPAAAAPEKPAPARSEPSAPLRKSAPPAPILRKPAPAEPVGAPVPIVPVVPPRAPAPAPLRSPPARADLATAGPPASDLKRATPWSNDQVELFMKRLKGDADLTGLGLFKSLYSASKPEVVADIVRNPLSTLGTIDRSRRGLPEAVARASGQAWIDFGLRLAYAKLYHQDDVPWIEAVGPAAYDRAMRKGQGTVRLHDPD